MTKLTTKDPAGLIILAYINENASEALTEKINAGTKTMDGCMAYIAKEARKRATNNCACIEDKEVFGWAMHFFEEDDIPEEKTSRPVAKVSAVAEEPKKEEKPKAPKKATKKPEPEAQLEGQIDIFQILGGGI